MQTLTEYLQSHRQVWNDNYIVDNYRRIIRNIIHIFAELERYFERCDLNLEHLTIVDNQVQRSFRNYVRRRTNGRLCKLQCKFVLERILGKDDRRKELKHFYEMAQIQGVTLTDLWHHPLLMTCCERYYFPYEALIELMCVENWETDYANYTENHIPSYGKRNIETTIQNSKYAIAFESVYHETYKWEDGYRNNAVGELTYSKNVVDRIGTNLAKTNQNSLTMHEVEQELTSLFPERLTELYRFFVVKKKITMSFLLSSRV